MPDVELPNPFLFNDGSAVQTPTDWPRRRAELLELVVGVEYGGMPPTPAWTTAELLHDHQEGQTGQHFRTYRLHTGPDEQFAFTMTVLIPPGDGPFPVVINGDGCWRYVTDEVAQEVVRRGLILAQFNRVELAPDVYTADRNSGLYLVYPEGTYGALSAWAWGYHRCVDALSTMPFVDADRIAVVGHSRGGKCVLLAGATDERIALTAPNNSGAGGAGCYHFQGPESETLDDTMRLIAYWFGPRMRDYLGRVDELPFDQHSLKALVAPRALLSTEALGDLWANPTGTWRTHLAAREVYRFLSAEDRLGIWFRNGGHRHGPGDWRAFLDFLDWQLRDRPQPAGFRQPPFGDLSPGFSWRAPGT